ncbi:hypothetical protein [Mesorhizobium sp. CO1-1-8]|uniref:hypothetical protein n=1 Tax=Mesorhizobium sp. CO1-1-8 TaxID=2876631 RepID=UPI001CD06DB8|nr:hypothetical protein [Mesorhizobium sp. CO1-1-8]MBZ9772350.1 hypothetical protein [Mesorhizobium sp. CO1-1-8]
MRQVCEDELTTRSKIRAIHGGLPRKIIGRVFFDGMSGGSPPRLPNILTTIAVLIGEANPHFVYRQIGAEGSKYASIGTLGPKIGIAIFSTSNQAIRKS